MTSLKYLDDNHSEKASYFAGFSRHVLEKSAELLRAAKADGEERQQNGRHKLCRLGRDVDEATLSDIGGSSRADCPTSIHGEKRN